MIHQRSPDIGLEIWEKERAETGCYDPSFSPERDGQVTQEVRRAARKRGRRALSEAILAAYDERQMDPPRGGWARRDQDDSDAG